MGNNKKKKPNRIDVLLAAKKATTKQRVGEVPHLPPAPAAITYRVGHYLLPPRPH